MITQHFCGRSKSNKNTDTFCHNVTLNGTLRHLQPQKARIPSHPVTENNSKTGILWPLTGPAHQTRLISAFH